MSMSMPQREATTVVVATNLSTVPAALPLHALPLPAGRPAGLVALLIALLLSHLMINATAHQQMDVLKVLPEVLPVLRTTESCAASVLP